MRVGAAYDGVVRCPRNRAGTEFSTQTPKYAQQSEGRDKRVEQGAPVRGGGRGVCLEGLLLPWGKDAAAPSSPL